ncbi:MAG TPA: glycosyltransferase family 1 protein [Chloroflexota bacterium]|nr:glycosyltransferase family 1 protein [Chloroflexota bacterium]
MAGLIGVDASRAIRPIQTGTERYSRALIQTLLARPGERRYRLYFDRPPQGCFGDAPNAEQRVIRMPRGWTHLGLGTEIARRPPDLLFVPSHVLPVVCRVPSVATIHDVGYLWHREAYSPLAWLLLHLGTLRNTRADRIIADSEATTRDLIANFRVDPARVRVAYLGGPTEQSIGDPTAARQVYKLPARYFLFVGTLQPRKNLRRLLQAFARIAPRYPDVGLALAGQAGHGAPALVAEVARLGLSERVQLLGYVPPADLPSLFAAAVGFVFPSLYEGFGMPALEAMVWGTPVIASKASSLPEVVGDAGLLVDPYDVASLADALARLLEDPALRQELIAAGRSRAGLFTWDRCSEGVEAVFDELTG